MIVLHIIEIVLFCYLATCVLYNFLFSVSGWIGKLKKYNKVESKNFFAIVIPTYKDDNIILKTVETALSQDYSFGKFDVIVVADQLGEDTILHLETLPIELIRASFTKSTKAKSLKLALDRLPVDKYDSILILDSDNLLGPRCLEKANHALNSGFKMVQLHRTAKNKNTPTAILDAISEEIGNVINRKGHRFLGLSASLIGSGMAFDYSLFRSVLMEQDIEENPAEDRAVNTEMLKRGLVCEYIDDAFVYDEKVQSGRVLEKQRTRWISAQLQYADYFWIKNFSYLFKYNGHYFDYAFQTLLLPRVLMLGGSFVMAGVSFIVYSTTGYNIYPGFISWILLLVLVSFSLFICTYSVVSFGEFLTALRGLPKILVFFLRAAFKSRRRASEFIHTPKEFV